MVDRKKVESAVHDLAESMERVANQPETNKHKKCNKEKINTAVHVASGVVCWLIVGGFTWCVVSGLYEYSVAEKQSKKQKIRQEYLDSIHNYGYVTDSVYNILKQNTK